MLEVEKLSDAELRAELTVRGENIGPVTGTTRSLYEKKLKRLIAAGGKTPARPSSAASSKPTPKPTPKPAAKVTTPAKAAVVKPKTPESNRRSLPRPSANISRNITQSSTINRSENEEYSDSDEDDIEEEEEILAPKSANTSRLSSGRSVVRPAPSVTAKKPSPKAAPTPKTEITRTPPRVAYSSTGDSTSRTSTTISTTTRIPTTPRSIHVPNLITEFTPSFSNIGGDRPGATPPRNRGRVAPSSIYSSKGLQDLGNTTGEEDEDDLEGRESSRIIYKSKESSGGAVKNAWNKMLGYGFNASKNPGDSYDLRAGSSRISVLKNPKTGRVTVKQTSVFNDAIWVALYAIIILFAVLFVAYVVTNGNTEKANFSGYWTVFKSAVRDSINFFYNYAILPVVSVGLLIVIGAGLFFGHRKYKEAKELEEAKLFELIERVTELVKESAVEGDPYVSQPHVRDIIFPPAKRRATEMARWETAVKFIDTNESRIATDLVLLPSGNECAVWKWIGHKPQKRW